MRAFWSTAELRQHGRSARDIAAAARSGALIPVRPGWYAVPGADPQVVRAVRVGGAATAHTASRTRSLWTPPDPFEPGATFRRPLAKPPPVLRVALPTTAALSRLRDPDDAAVGLGNRSDVLRYWTNPAAVRAAQRTGLVTVPVMLRDVFGSEPPERALAVVESAMRSRFLRIDDLPALAAMLPARLRPVLAQADPSAESGLETVVRYLLRRAGLTVQCQARIDGVGNVDLLVEGRLIVETDGREWHDDSDAFERDRRRDLTAAIGRYRTVRFTWFQVLYRWPHVEAAVFAALAA